MKIKAKACRLLLLTSVLMAILLLPQPSIAQERQLELTLTLFPYRAEAKAGEDNTFFLEVRNAGSRAITDIRLSSEKPEEGWVIGFSPAEIASLAPESFYTVDVNIRPPSSAAKGGYSITVIAEANEIRKVESIWVTVKTASFWLWIGVGTVILVVAGFILVFMRFGRQK